jgi:ribosomal protein S18 acetylase RimI-like enzyme
VLGRLKDMPYGEAVLWTFKENERAIAFYERHGWRRDGAEQIHPRSGEPVVRMRRAIG